MNTNDNQASEITTSETAAVEAPTPKNTHNKYPFQTKREILSLLSEDGSFRNECVLLINAKQTAHEQATLTTKVRNYGGWMSSDAVRMGRVANKLAACETLTLEEDYLVEARIPHYGKQLASHFRAEALENKPELAVEAAAFFKG
jgi:hypothetical protein